MVMVSLIIGTVITFAFIAGAIIFICIDDARSKKKEEEDGKK